MIWKYIRVKWMCREQVTKGNLGLVKFNESVQDTTKPGSVQFVEIW